MRAWESVDGRRQGQCPTQLGAAGNIPGQLSAHCNSKPEGQDVTGLERDLLRLQGDISHTLRIGSCSDTLVHILEPELSHETPP